MTLQEAIDNLSAAKDAAEVLRSELNHRLQIIVNLEHELTEARKQPVRLLPEVTEKIAHEMCREYNKCDYSQNEIGRAYNTVLARHFREAAEARVKPTIDVEAVAKEISIRYHVHGFCTVREAAIHVLSDRCADTTNQPLQNMQQLPDETLAARDARMKRTGIVELLDDFLMVNMQEPVKDNEDPRDALQRLIDWETQTLLDPLVSKPALELKRAGALEALRGLPVPRTVTREDADKHNLSPFWVAHIEGIAQYYRDNVAPALAALEVECYERERERAAAAAAEAAYMAVTGEDLEDVDE